ncbi:beta strand repeat-containing protein [Larkinella sp. VNQ87]|uniref:beta strand repeat-containing protein n=1 Tax=Larkinella sp. VNQ87 TaxID=3400921 RepID=UPI003C02A0F3
MSLASTPWLRLLWLTGLAIALLVGTAKAQCPPTVPTSTVTTSTNCLTANGSITFTGPNTITHVFSIDGGATFGIVGQTAFTNLAPGNYATVAKLVSLSCVSAVVTKTVTTSGAPVAPTSTVTATNCNGPTGIITFSAPSPATHVFSTDGGLTYGAVGQTSFTGLAAGNYNTVAKNIATGCVSPVAVKTIVVATAPVTPTSTVVSSTNCLTANGSITFTAPTPVANYQFSVDNGVSFGTTGQTSFTGLTPGTYQTVAKLVSTGCVSVATAKTVLASGAPVAPTSTVTATNCNGPTGIITFSAPSPATHVFSTDGGLTFGVVGQTGFPNLAAGSYPTVAKLVSTGCVSTTAVKTITVVAPPVAPTSTVVSPTNCLTANGSITFTAPTPVANYQFSVDNGVSFGTTGQTSFTGLAPGTYQTVAKLVSTGCVSLTTAAATKTLVISGAPAAPTSTVTPTNCTAATGTITFTAPAPATHVFSVDGGANFGAVGQTVFPGLDADNYQTIAKNIATGCVSVIATKAVTTAAAPAAPTSTVTNAASCNTPNGNISFSAPAPATHLFSTDGGLTYGVLGQTLFPGLAPGTYQTVAKSIVTGCVSPIVIKTVVPATTVAAPTSTFTNVTSCLPNNGSITFSAPTPVANYQFSIDGGESFGTTGQTSFTGLAAGSYTTMAKLVSTGCVSTTTAASVKVLVNTVAVPVPSFVAHNGENDCANLGSIVFSAPSPVTHIFSINGGATYGTSGQVLFTGLTAGTYVLRAKLVSTGCESVTALNTTVQIACNNVEICGNGIDDDGDNFIDQFDSDCPCTIDGFINVCQPDCEYQPSAKPFTIKKVFSTSSAATNQVAVYQTPMVADVDGDGVVEIVAIGINKIFTPDVTGARSTKDILIFNGKTGSLERTINTGNFWINWSGQSQLAIGNTDKSDAQAEIYTITHSNTTLNWYTNNPTAALTCYKADGTLLWRNTTALVSAGLGTSTSGGAIGLADFNGDGIAEVYVYNKIYNAQTGTLLVSGPAAGGVGSSWAGPISVAGDLTGHPGLELAAGKSVYEITITNPNGTAGNSIVEKRMPAAYPDGTTALADIDLDGQMDVIVRLLTTLYVYDPRTMNIIASATVPAPQGSGAGNTFIGDVDNDGDPDIGITATDYIGMYGYNGTTTLALKWSKATTDGSGLTGITMFDFNQDGKQELVYRDESNLRIMDGSTGNNIVTFPSISGTGYEMPVVADVNSDGQANIVVTSGINTIGGVVDVFSTASFPWAPSREMWNQVPYNVTNIKDDLTIPTNPQDNAVTFPNGKRILNNFLQQATIYDENGDPVFPAVDVQITFDPNAIDPATGYAKASTNYFSSVCENSLPISASLTIPLVNNGNIPTPVNMPVSIYRGDPFSSASAVLVQTIIVSDPIPANGGTFTTGVTINTTGFPTPFKLYAIPGDPGATTGLPLTFNTYFQDLGFCASQSNNAVYGEFSCTCPVITNITTDNLNPTLCGGADGSIKVCGLSPNSTGYALDYDKNGVAQPTLTNQTADASGCLSLTGLTAGIYNNIRVSNAGCTAGSNLIGPITLTSPAPPAAPTASATNLTVCSGNQVTITYTTNPVGQTVQWTRMPGGLSGLGTVNDSPLATDTDPVSYTYTAKIIGPAGCVSDSVKTVVLVNPVPIVTPSVCSQTICVGETGVISFTSSVGGTTINWLRVEDGATGSGDISELFTTAGTYTYKIWGATLPPASCPTSDTITCTIVVNNACCDLVATLGATPISNCNNVADGSLEIEYTGSATYQYSLNGGTFQAVGASPFTITGLSAGSYTVVVQSTTNPTCLSALTGVVVIPTAPVVSTVVVSNPTTCTANDGGLAVVLVNGSEGVFEYSIDNGSSWQISNTFAGLAAGNYTVLVRNAVAPTCFVNAGSFTIQTPGSVTATIGGQNQDVCALNQCTITISAGGGSGAYEYSLDGGLTWADLSPNPFTRNNLAPSNYLVVVRDKNIPSCKTQELVELATEECPVPIPPAPVR